MSKLIICLGNQTFSPEVTKIEKNEEGQWRYWNYRLALSSSETVRLIRHLGYCRFEDVYYTWIEISKTEEDTRGFFGGEKVVTKYWLKTTLFDEKLQPQAFYLEE